MPDSELESSLGAYNIVQTESPTMLISELDKTKGCYDLYDPIRVNSLGKGKKK